MRVLLTVIATLIFPLLANAADKTEGQKCRPFGPLKGTDKVDMVARCHCETAAQLGAAAFDAAGSAGYFPKNIRDWRENMKDVGSRKVVAYADPEAHFVTLVSSAPRGTNGAKIEKYYYYQGSDGGYVEQFKLSEVTVQANVQSDNSATCNIVSVTAAGY